MGMRVAVNDAVLVKLPESERVFRVIAVTDDGRAIVGLSQHFTCPHLKVKSESHPGEWPIIGIFRGALFWKFIPRIEVNQ